MFAAETTDQTVVADLVADYLRSDYPNVTILYESNQCDTIAANVASSVMLRHQPILHIMHKGQIIYVVVSAAPTPPTVPPTIYITALSKSYRIDIADPTSIPNAVDAILKRRREAINCCSN